MKNHHPAGTVLCAALACFALGVLWFAAVTGCYHCDGPNCSNLPCPGGDPGPCLDKQKDASRD